LELTESLVLEDVGDTIAKMKMLKDFGVSFSMDDFGTGYSSLSYLKRLPLDQIKIDQSFVRDLATDNADMVMVMTLIDLGMNFEVDVIAEGVETEEQFKLLQRYGCASFQGYLFSKPVPVEQFEALVKLNQHKPSLKIITGGAT
jgi:EAL domain-containing protein (putative c-di-GMP-specific phosphodiesterase class I)